MFLFRWYFLDQWEGIGGDPVKLALGLTSLVYDVIFLWQHFILYKDTNNFTEENVAISSPGSQTDERSRLLNIPWKISIESFLFEMKWVGWYINLIFLTTAFYR